MFLGALPHEVLSQVATTVTIDGVKDVYVCFSGGFRVEQMLCQVASPAIVSCDTSLASCAVGGLATGQPLDFRFVGELAHFEERLVGASARRRGAALMLGETLGGFAGGNEYAQLHREHYLVKFNAYVDEAEEKLAKLLGSFRIARFAGRDFREHAREGAALGALVIAAAPVGGAGRFSGGPRFLAKNVLWAAPAGANKVAPKAAEAFLEELHASGAPYCFTSEERYASHEPKASFAYDNKAIYLYARTAAPSFLRREKTFTVFRYDPVEPSLLRKNSVVRLMQVGAGEMNFLKEQYLARGIAHKPGQLNFLVYVDDRLCGGFIYRRSERMPRQEIYLLCDLSITRERKLSKLIAMLAASEMPIAVAEKALLMSAKWLATTAFSKNAVSMKYRGIYELHSRGTDHLNYRSPIRKQSPQEVYREWWRTFGKPGS